MVRRVGLWIIVLAAACGGEKEPGPSYPGFMLPDAETPEQGDGASADGSSTEDGGDADGSDADGASAGDGSASGDGGDGDPTSHDGSSDEPIASSGCGKAVPASGARTIAVTGVPEGRRYLLDIPPNYDANRAYPLVFGFHGATSSAESFRSAFYGNLPGVAGGEAILVHGQAMSVNGTTAWNHDSDLAYFDAVLAEVTSELCIDEGRVFATGHSSGGYYTNRLGCSRGDKLRAIAPLAGGGPGFGAFAPSCVGQVAAWIEHGSTDSVVTLPSGEGSRDFWRMRNHCSAESTETTPSGCVAYTDCDDGFPVHWCVSAGGHEPRPNFTAAGAWEFFKQF
jgi:poly(3-hydroxybutyrate) depolymerase